VTVLATLIVISYILARRQRPMGPNH
jgi:hypothetical protein